MRKKITVAEIAKLKAGVYGDEIMWDTEVSTFGARPRATGVFYLAAPRVGGRKRWLTIGRDGDPANDKGELWAPDIARRRARVMLGAIASGEDPAAVRDIDKQNPTVKQLAEDWLEEHVKAKRKASTHDWYKMMLKKHVYPRIGSTKAHAITTSDIGRIHHKLKSTPYSANRVRDILAAMFAWADRPGFCRYGLPNPCKAVEKYPEYERTAFLSDAQLTAIGEAMAKAERENTETPWAIAAIRLLMITGARKNEILKAKWEDVDEERNVLVLPDDKAIRHRRSLKEIMLTAPALAVLEALPRVEKNPYIIVGDKEGGHLTDVKKQWRRIQKAAGLSGVRPHDLRHAFGGAASAGGLPLQGIAKLLGHTRVRTTERYAKFAPDPARLAAERLSKRINAAMVGKKGQLVKFPAKKGAARG